MRILKRLVSKYISIVLVAAIFVSGVPATGVYAATDATQSIISGITLEGKRWNDTKNDWQYVLKSYLEFNSSSKDRATKALFGTDDKSETLTENGFLKRL